MRYIYHLGLLLYSLMRAILKKPNGRDQAEMTLFCSQPWTTIFITCDGEVRTCCGSEKAFGNLKKEEINNIWNGDTYKEYRENIASNMPPEECINCLKNARPKHVFSDILRDLRVLRGKDLRKFFKIGKRYWLFSIVLGLMLLGALFVFT